jgi:hypothetical protein
MPQALGERSSAECARCGACEHFDGAPGTMADVGTCHHPTASTVRPKQESEYCEGFVASTSIAWREPVHIVYALPPRRPVGARRHDVRRSSGPRFAARSPQAAGSVARVRRN